MALRAVYLRERPLRARAQARAGLSGAAPGGESQADW